MKTLNKVILLLINILGAIALIAGLFMPFLGNETEIFIFSIWLIATGFVLWYLSAKLIQQLD